MFSKVIFLVHNYIVWTDYSRHESISPKISFKLNNFVCLSQMHNLKFNDKCYWILIKILSSPRRSITWWKARYVFLLRWSYTTLCSTDLLRRGFSRPHSSWLSLGNRKRKSFYSSSYNPRRQERQNFSNLSILFYCDGYRWKFKKMHTLLNIWCEKDTCPILRQMNSFKLSSELLTIVTLNLE